MDSTRVFRIVNVVHRRPELSDLLLPVSQVGGSGVGQLLGTLTECPPTERPSDIWTTTERPLYSWSTVIERPR